jgi:hypothetical protein
VGATSSEPYNRERSAILDGFHRLKGRGVFDSGGAEMRSPRRAIRSLLGDHVLLHAAQLVRRFFAANAAVEDVEMLAWIACPQHSFQPLRVRGNATLPRGVSHL